MMITSQTRCEKVYPGVSLPADQRSLRVKNVNISETLKKITQYFQDQRPYLDEDVTLAHVSNKLNLRPDQLSAILNMELNMSFPCFISQYRINEACRLIKEKKTLSFINICFICGFGSPSSFNRAFRRHVNMSPAEFRRKCNYGVSTQ